MDPSSTEKFVAIRSKSAALGNLPGLDAPTSFSLPVTSGVTSFRHVTGRASGVELHAIPQIDISRFLSKDERQRRRVAKEWARAFETTGFATIVGHTIPEGPIEDLHTEALIFFVLPLEEEQLSALHGEKARWAIPKLAVPIYPERRPRQPGQR